jgi:hypothetical protein
MNADHIAKMRAGRKNAKVLNPIKKSDNNPTSVRKAVDAQLSMHIVMCVMVWKTGWQGLNIARYSTAHCGK